MKDYLPYIQIILSILVIVSILLQQRGAALSQAFGGEGDVFASRRGAERWLFVATIIFSILFFATAIINLILE